LAAFNLYLLQQYNHAYYEYTGVVDEHFVQHLQGHGFRNALISMLLDLRPRFLRFPGIFFVFKISHWNPQCLRPLFDLTTSHCLSICIPFSYFTGGCFVEGNFLKNAFRWKDTVGPWEERPGHFGDVWQYWTDDGLGYYELLQVFLD
jgi:alpha-N-arabinofuranosidase